MAAFGVLVHDRSRIVSFFWTNTPDKVPRIDTFGSHSVKFADRVRSCEDFVLVEDRGVAIAACDAGRERWNTVMVSTKGGPLLAVFPLLSIDCIACLPGRPSAWGLDSSYLINGINVY